MEELWELRRYLEASDVAGALALLDEMEAMAKDDKIDRMASYIQGSRRKITFPNLRCCCTISMLEASWFAWEDLIVLVRGRLPVLINTRPF